jgi:hypothetical protein
MHQSLNRKPHSLLLYQELKCSLLPSQKHTPVDPDYSEHNPAKLLSACKLPSEVKPLLIPHLHMPDDHMLIGKLVYQITQGETAKQRCAPVSMGNTFQDLPRLRETADNTKRYI